MFVAQLSSTILKSDSLKILVKKIFYNYIASILMGLASILGLVLLVIPGFYIAFRLSLVSFFIFIEDKGVVESLGDSFRSTKNNVLRLALLSFIVLLVMMLVYVLPWFALVWLGGLLFTPSYTVIFSSLIVQGMFIFLIYPLLSAVYSCVYYHLTFLPAHEQKPLNEEMKTQ